MLRLTAVVLFDEVVQVIRLANLDGQAAVGLDARDGGCIRAALVDGDLLGYAVQVDGALEKCPGRGVISLCTQQEVDGVAVAINRPGLRRWLMKCLRWRVGWRWVLLAFLFPVAFMSLAAAVHVAFGGTLPASPAAGRWGMAAFNFLLIFLVGGPLGEELGWRGYALPALRARWGWRAASLMLSVVWAVWHLPLFYSADTVQSHLPMGLYALSAIASSVLFAWLFNCSRGSIVPVLVLHTAVNAWSLIIPVMVLPDGSNLRPFQIVVGILVLTAVALLFTGERSPDKLVAPAKGFALNPAGVTACCCSRANNFWLSSSPTTRRCGPLKWCCICWRCGW